MAVYLVIYRLPFALIAAGLFAVALVAVALLGSSLSVVEQFLTRDSHRLFIWSIALEAAAERPLLGHGVATVAVFGREDFTFPHSLYLSALFYGGAVGLALLCGLFGYVFWRAAFVAERQDRPFLLALLTVPFVAGLTDIGQPIGTPSELWYILWLPIIVILGRTQQQRLSRGAWPETEDVAGNTRTA